MPTDSHSIRWLVCSAIFMAIAGSSIVFGKTEDNFGPRYSKSQPIYFELGLKITSKGSSSGILGTVPVPIDWPEQKVTIVKQTKTDNLRNITFKDLKRDVRQMVLKANRLNVGEFAQGTVLFRIDKKFIELPADKTKLLLAKKIPSKIKQYLKPSPYIESDHKRIKKLAAEIEFSENQTAWERVEFIYKWVRETIEYEFDTKIHGCLDALDSGQGDCEELSSVFIAICRAKGIPARAVWIPGHTYPEFYLVDENGNGYWLPCQVAGSYEFGAMTEAKPILQKGDRFKLPGSREPLRYVQPTLVAKDSNGGLAIEFIARQITDPAELKLLSGPGK